MVTEYDLGFQGFSKCILFLLEFEKCYKIAIITTNQQMGGAFTPALGRNYRQILRDD
jgi:hypothetical protein